MASAALHDSRQKVTDHLEALQGYAQKTLVDGDALSSSEAADKSARLSEFVTLGNSFKLTVKEMVVLILGEISYHPAGCGCHSCAARGSRTAVTPEPK